MNFTDDNSENTVNNTKVNHIEYEKGEYYFPPAPMLFVPTGNLLNMDLTIKPLFKYQPIQNHEQVLASLLNEIQPVDYRVLAELSEGEVLTQQQQVVISIEQIIEKAKSNKWSLCTSRQSVYLYNGAYWKEIEEAELESFLGKAAEALGIHKLKARYHKSKTDLLKQFYSAAYFPRPKNKEKQTLINLQNGTFCITPEKQFLREFKREDFIKYQLPFKYDKDAEAPLFNQFLLRVQPEENNRKLLAEYVGYVFISTKALKLEKSLMLYGSGANGKSVIFEIVKSLLGPENVSHFSLQSLTNDTGYQRAKLENKLLNYASEISAHMQSTIFKQLVSGEPVEARLPYKEPFILDDYAKLMFNTNRLPVEVEHNDAFFRRFIIIPFLVTIPESDRDPELANKIINNELPGVFNWVLDGLQRLLEQKKFTYSDSSHKMLMQYRQQSDPVQLFLADGGYVVDNQNKLGLKELFDEYKQYSSECNYKTCSLKEFANRLRNIGFETNRVSRGMMLNCSKKVFETAT